MSTQPFQTTGVVRRDDGVEPTDLLVVVEDRDLPSRERQRPSGALVLGAATTDREGRFQLEFEAPAGPDLTFRVVGRDGRSLVVREVTAGDHVGRGEDVLFNAVSPLEVALSVSPAQMPAEESEYATLVTRITPELGDLAPGDLAEDDLDFLARELGPDPDDETRRRLAFVRAANLLSRSSGLVAPAFYGWARLRVVELWAQLPTFEDPERRDDFLGRLLDELAGADPERLAEALRHAADERIIPPMMGERAESLAYAVRRRLLAGVTVRMVLSAERDGEPLAGYAVHAFDATAGGRDLGEDVTDALGAIVIGYDTDEPAAPRALRLRVSGLALPEPVEVDSDVVPPTTDVRVPVPDAAPGLRSLVSDGHLQVTPQTLDRLEAAGIGGYAEIRRRGGLAALTGPNGPLSELDHDDAHRLAALTELDLLTPDPGEAATLLGLSYPGLRAVAEAPWGRFLAEVAAPADGEQPEGRLPYHRAVALRAAAAAHAGRLDSLLVGYGTDLANGFSS